MHHPKPRMARRLARRYLDRRAFVSNPLVYLKDYLNQTDAEKGAELAGLMPHVFAEWAREEFEPGETGSDELDAFLRDEIESWDVDFWSLDPKIKERFFQMGGWENHASSVIDMPSWHYMDFRNIVKNQWMIHFTDDADGVACGGFKYGMDDVTRLGLTTYYKNTAKPGGYSFAYDIGNWERYAHGRHGFKYGDEAVMFKASGVRVDHYGDQEEQIIFWGDTAKDIVPLTEGYYGGWYANGIGKGGREEGEGGEEGEAFDSLSEAVDWVYNNFNQYKRLLTC